VDAYTSKGEEADVSYDNQPAAVLKYCRVRIRKNMHKNDMRELGFQPFYFVTLRHMQKRS